MPEQISQVLAEAISTDGFTFHTEARRVRSGEFSGVFHLLATDDDACEPAVVVIAPGKWREENDAHQAAQRHALTMIKDGALTALLHSLGRAYADKG